MTSSKHTTLSVVDIQSSLPSHIREKLDDILLYDETTSTNDVLWQRFSEGKSTPAICLAETQTQGRGRRGDLWQSPTAGNLYFSLYWPHAANHAFQGLSIAIGITLINTLKEAGINNLQLKWPNDVLFNRQKLAGILVESRYNTKQNTVVGIGLNFKLPKTTQDQIQQPTTSLEQLCEVLPDRNWLAGKITHNMIETLEIFENRGLIDFLPLWPQYDALHEQAITLVSESETISALACGINENGELRYMRNQHIHHLSNSHVSIRFAS